MKEYLKLRTFIVLGVIAVFACAIPPLKPLDFYDTFRASLKDRNQSAEAEKIITEARAAQSKRADLYPAAALLDAANAQGVELKDLTLNHVKEFKKELDDAGINPTKLSPQLLPNYTKQQSI